MGQLHHLSLLRVSHREGMALGHMMSMAVRHRICRCLALGLKADWQTLGNFLTWKWTASSPKASLDNADFSSCRSIPAIPGNRM